ncbi:MAG: M23 family metallopeptidase [Saprospiraceae bacterium]|nr:M23 family metallopeptidase [Saprospiraceae bacterium]
MEESPDKRPRKLKKPYRLVVLKEDSLEEVGSYRLTPLGLYVLFSSLFVGLSIVVALLIIFTPLKRWIPGYGEGSSHTEMVRLRSRIGEMEKQLLMQERYTESIRRMLTGDVTTNEDEITGQTTLNDSLLQVSRIEEDEILRQSYLLGEGLPETAGPVRESTSASIPLAQLLFTPPVTGEISAGFTPEDNHLGIDIIAPRNTPVKAAMDGFVVFSDWTLETGNSIALLHDHHVVTFYKHNSMLLKKAGQFVRAGEAIAIIGNTGTMTSGPHLHFEIWHKGKAVDPARYVRF